MWRRYVSPAPTLPRLAKKGPEAGQAAVRHRGYGNQNNRSAQSRKANQLLNGAGRIEAAQVRMLGDGVHGDAWIVCDCDLGCPKTRSTC